MITYIIIPNTPANLILMPDLLADIPAINTEYRSGYMLKKSIRNIQVGNYMFGNELNFLIWLTSLAEIATFDLIGFTGAEAYEFEVDLLAAYENYFIPLS